MRTCKCGCVCPSPERLEVHKRNCPVLLQATIAKLEAKLAKREAQIHALIRPLSDHYTNQYILEIMGGSDE